MKCVCGTEIPDKGADYEPGCRFCERLKVDRGFREITKV